MEEAVPHYSSRESLYRRELAVFAAGIALLLGAGYLAWFLIFRVNAPDAVVKSFIEADRAGRYSQQDALIADRWDSTMMLETIQTFRRQSGVSPFDRYRMLGTSVNGENAQVEVEVTVNVQPVPAFPGLNPPTPQTLIIPFHLVKQKDRWKIDPSRTLIGLTGVLMATGFQNLMPQLGNLIPPSPGGAPQPPPAAAPKPSPAPARP